MGEEFNTVVVTVKNPTFPLIRKMTTEERQARAEKDELSTVECPLFILDNTSTTKKIAEWERNKSVHYKHCAVKRDDFRVEVNFTTFTTI